MCVCGTPGFVRVRVWLCLPAFMCMFRVRACVRTWRRRNNTVYMLNNFRSVDLPNNETVSARALSLQGAKSRDHQPHSLRAALGLQPCHLLDGLTARLLR